jgi:hypothetical protein
LFCSGWSNEEVRLVEIQRDDNGSLGLSIAGGKDNPGGDGPIIVAQMTPDGPAAQSQELRVSSLKNYQCFKSVCCLLILQFCSSMLIL